LTIEHKGPIPRELRPLMGNRIYGCDDCLAVCPWNKYAQAGREAKLAARETLRAPRLVELVRLDDAAFRAMFTKSPVKRTGRDRFVRNALVAIGNSGNKSRASEAERLLGDPSPLGAARRCGRCRGSTRLGSPRTTLRAPASTIPPCARNGPPRSNRPDVHPALPRARLLRASLRGRIRHPLRPDHGHVANAEACRRGRDAGV
jgi:hypothetical protein